jgi:SAM-dependent methyltransferase
MLSGRSTTVIDLGAGTGAQTRLLVERADRVVAVEPDARMLDRLTRSLPDVTTLHGRGEEIPVPDSSADAVVASSSWHWMDPARTLEEVARVLVPGGRLGVVWSGPDPDGPFLAQAAAMLARSCDGRGVSPPGDQPDDLDLSTAILDPHRPTTVLDIPAGAPFSPPEHTVLSWDVALNADDLIGLLGTFSWIITMPDDRRARVFAEARRLLKEGLGVEEDVTVDVAYGADVWRADRLG